MSAYLIVRARIEDPAARDAFDRWYEAEHLPDAIRAFEARRGWRGWSVSESNVHFAFYEFESIDRAGATMGSPAMKSLVAEFDRHWEGKVTRTREVVDCGMVVERSEMEKR